MAEKCQPVLGHDEITRLPVSPNFRIPYFRCIMQHHLSRFDVSDSPKDIRLPDRIVQASIPFDLTLHLQFSLSSRCVSSQG